MSDALSGQPIAIAADTMIDIPQCRCCNGHHENLLARRFKSDNPPYTHFYLCPTNNEPVNMAIMQCGAVTATLNDRVLRDIFRFQSQPSIFCTVGVDGSQHIATFVHRHNFQVERLDDALVQIILAIEGLRDSKFDRETLQRACVEFFMLLERARPKNELPPPLKRADLAALFGMSGAISRTDKNIAVAKQWLDEQRAQAGEVPPVGIEARDPESDEEV